MSDPPELHPNQLALYRREIHEQAATALAAHRSMRQIVRAMARRETRRQPMRTFWRYAQFFVLSVGLVSLLLSPSPRRKKELQPIADARAKALRADFGFTDDSALLDRELRDNFAHLDERFDDWVSRSEPRRGYADWNIGPRRAVPHADHDLFRHYDPATDELIFGATRFPLGPVRAELERITRKPPPGYAYVVKEPGDKVT